MGTLINTSRVVAILAVVTAVAACGDDDPKSASAVEPTQASDSAGTDLPLIVVTTNILGDVVSAAVGSTAEVEVVMPLGSDPHDFAPSARQAESMEDADLLVTNGAGFEEGMLDIIANVSDSGTPIFAFADHIELLEFGGEDDHHDGDHDHDDESTHDGDHADEGTLDDEYDHDHDDEGTLDDDHDHDHDHGPEDPHLWTDPTRVAAAVEALEAVIVELEGVDADELSASIDSYLTALADLDSTMEATLDVVRDGERVLITNHEVFGYFADRFDFDVVGAVIPSLTTNAEPSAADLEGLADLIRDEGIPAIFAETTQSSRLADVLAAEVGEDVEVVELFSESLGEPGSGAETYLTMMALNAELIASALSS